MRLDYNKLKKSIIKSCKQESANTLNFSIAADNLNRFVNEYGLILRSNLC